MKAYEFSAEVNDDEENQIWSKITAEQFLAGYSESDNIYDIL
jgi:hypothetical protein